MVPGATTGTPAAHPPADINRAGGDPMMRRRGDDGRPRSDVVSGLCPCCHCATHVDVPETDRICRICGWKRSRPEHRCWLRDGEPATPAGLAPPADYLLGLYGPCLVPVADRDGGTRPCRAARAEWTYSSPAGDGRLVDLLVGLCCTAHPEHGPDRPPFNLAPLEHAKGT